MSKYVKTEHGFFKIEHIERVFDVKESTIFRTDFISGFVTISGYDNNFKDYSAIELLDIICKLEKLESDNCYVVLDSEDDKDRGKVFDFDGKVIHTISIIKQDNIQSENGQKPRIMK